MTPKEKAESIIHQYDLMQTYMEDFGPYDVKKCSLITVNEIINAIDWHQHETPNDQLNFWQQVKQEIEKL